MEVREGQFTRHSVDEANSLLFWFGAFGIIVPVRRKFAYRMSLILSQVSLSGFNLSFCFAFEVRPSREEACFVSRRLLAVGMSLSPGCFFDRSARHADSETARCLRLMRELMYAASQFLKDFKEILVHRALPFLPPSHHSLVEVHQRRKVNCLSVSSQPQYTHNELLGVDSARLICVEKHKQSPSFRNVNLQDLEVLLQSRVV
mmetsp:Transcript_42029/g.65598  ORF Transcript_42029/g.65598 Transcript_42029/m.65598 type:complete len:203 (+) Transcript_42029:160-768(+)